MRESAILGHLDGVHVAQVMEVLVPELGGWTSAHLLSVSIGVSQNFFTPFDRIFVRFGVSINLAIYNSRTTGASDFFSHGLILTFG